VVDDCSKIIAGLPLRQWDHLPESAIVVPIWTDTSTGLPRAVLILGLNLLCPLDSAYEDWIHVLRAHLTSSLSSVRAYEAEQQRLLDKERMERAKTAWFQGAAHDIRTPLTLVAGPLEDTLATALTPKQRSSLVLAQRNVARIQRLITSLLDFSRIEAGKLSGRFVPTDLGRFVGDLAALFRPAAERRQITFNVELDPSESSVYIDPLLLETVVTNLLSNALKYTEQGNITIRLAYGSHADIDIIDTGCGIPAGELEAVTDRFHRATTALARGIEGTGIGLALAKEILGLHGGELFIYSQTAEETGGPHGSTFRARIPLVERSSDVDGPEPASFGAYGKAVAADAMQWNQSDDWLGTPVSETPSDLERHMVPADVLVFDATDTVLLVDDNRDMRAYIKRIFTPYCSVIEATDGEEALAIARANPPNLILSDMMMPKLDGHGLLVAIRNDPKTRLVPMVLLSAASDDDVRFAALTAGAEDFILKPFKPKELLARVQLHMQVGKRLISLEALYAQREKEIALLSDYCPSGIVRADAAGNLQYCNDAWRILAGMGPDDDPLSWPQRVDKETLAEMTTQWDEIVRGDRRETRMTWKWLTGGKTVSATFIRLDKVDPAMSGILGCLSDISYQEERMQEAERRRIEAEESKRQQELIVDVTSHEIRTPVSAILHCSSLVKENLAAIQAHMQRGDSLKPSEDLLRQIKADIEALESRSIALTCRS
jgi:signal transduction histidine kinase